MVRGVRVFLSVTEGMVHPVKHGISSWTQIRRTLRNISECIEKPLPKFAHREHFMGGITMQEKGLAEQGQIPMPNERGQYNHNDKIKR